MPLQNLRRSYEERRLNLIETLQKSKDDLELSKQHQLYGAIKEIEHLIKTIDSMRAEQLNGTDFELRREGPEPIQSRAAMALCVMGKKTKNAFVAVFWHAPKAVLVGTGRSIKRSHKKMKMYREVAREVKRRQMKEEEL